eukprot:TRINITY_DN3831_c0_g1_i2.p2 TRINITY_DN3831_c0_g1~~TRINITY_DN3831_c0_g1_i2.p2  ORF type:complete len:134 (+),score=52.67 TRINITY_DN3831_c0_g1_i2:177-578(+)
MDHEREDMQQWELQGHLQVMEIENKGKLSMSSKRTWHRKWCIISGQTLFLFNSPSDASPYLIIPLDLSISVTTSDYSMERPIILHSTLGNLKAAKDGKEKRFSEIQLLTDAKSKKFKWMMALSAQPNVQYLNQ